jgi:hypothetical protein
MKLSSPPKLVEKLVRVPAISFCKIFIPSYTFDTYYAETGYSRPPNRLTLSIILLPSFSNNFAETLTNYNYFQAGQMPE